MATEKRKIHRVVDAQGTLVQVLPETSAEQVTIADAGDKFTSSNVEGALQELANGVASAGKVDDVRNNASDASTSIVTNKIADMSKAVVKEAGKVSHWYQVIGTSTDGGTYTQRYNGDTYTTTKLSEESFIVTQYEGSDALTTGSAVQEVNLKDTGVTAGTYQGLTVDTKGRVTNAQDMKYATKQEVQEAMAGKAKTYTYDDYKSFVTAVDALGNTAMGVGDNVLIKTLDVPDMWVTRVNAVSTQYVYTTDQDIVNRLNTTNGLTVGYYTFSKLETTKVDLDPYQTKTDNTLTTNAKTVVGAINEVKGVADGAATKANSNASVIADIQDGKVTVGEARKVANKLQIRTTITGSPVDAGDFDGSALRNLDFGKNFTIESAENTTTVNVSGAPRVENSLTLTGSSSGNVQSSFEYNGSKAFRLYFLEDDFIFPPNPTTGFGMVTLRNTGVTAGQYSAVNVDAKGRVTAGGMSQEFGTDGQTTPSANLMVNGLFWELQ